jgi:peptidoglycan/xylan/chitin deacetylase (PgdA/CDA1 family)
MRVGAVLALAFATLAAFVGIASAEVVADGEIGIAAEPPDDDVGPSGALAPPTTESCPAGHLAMTFDDGPGIHTEEVLGTLSGALATFFVLGAAVGDRPALTQQIDDLGHPVANHSYGHERLTDLADDEIRATIRETEQAIAAAGATPLPLMRPPYGDTDARVESAIEDTGHRQMLWDIDSRDWEVPADQIEANVLEALHDGAVILFHDGSSNTPETIEALPTIIAEARDRGYCFTTLTDDGTLAPLSFVDSGALAHTAAIERVAAAGITVGCDSDGDRYCPHRSVTRAQMASFLSNAFDLDDAPDQGFEDVPADHVHAGSIDRLAALGITQGCAPDRFCPEAPVTRAQMASFLDGALSLDDAGDQGYEDVPADHVHVGPIDRLTAAGIVEGCAPGRYCPEDEVTRAQMASFLDHGVLRR